MSTLEERIAAAKARILALEAGWDDEDDSLPFAETTVDRAAAFMRAIAVVPGASALVETLVLSPGGNATLDVHTSRPGKAVQFFAVVPADVGESIEWSGRSASREERSGSIASLDEVPAFVAWLLT